MHLVPSRPAYRSTKVGATGFRKIPDLPEERLPKPASLSSLSSGASVPPLLPYRPAGDCCSPATPTRRRCGGVKSIGDPKNGTVARPSPNMWLPDPNVTSQKGSFLSGETGQKASCGGKPTAHPESDRGSARSTETRSIANVANAPWAPWKT